MTHFTPAASLAGGMLIGLAASALLVSHGRVAGITGILGDALRHRRGDLEWRLLFLGGLVCGGILLAAARPEALGGQIPRSAATLIVAGLLVGFGTRLANGCTSGHGVCGIGRLSQRSFVAVAVFIATGALTVLLGGGPS